MSKTMRCGFSLIELLVVLGIFGLLMGILLPAMEKVRERANNLKCAANLHQIGTLVLAYSNENHGYFPRTVYDPAAPLCAGTNPAAVDPFRAGGPRPNDVTAAIFLLLRTRGVPPIIFNEPYTDELDNTPEPASDLTSRSNFTDYRKNLGYSYANPYPDAAGAKAGYQLTSRLSGSFAIAGDQNPGIAGRNSRNHESRGQNILFADNHVEWTSSTHVGLNGDDVYTNKKGVVVGSPVDAGDSVLLPVDN